MTTVHAVLATVLFALAKLCRFNVFVGAFVGIVYGLIANVLDREFLGLGPTQITLLGCGCSVVFFALSIGLAALGNSFVSDGDSHA